MFKMSDLTNKQKWDKLVCRSRTTRECNIKSKIQYMCPSSKLWNCLGLLLPVYHLDLPLLGGPSFDTMCSVNVRSSAHPGLCTCTLWPMLFLDPSVFGYASLCICCRKDRITRSCTWHTCITWSAKSLSCFASLLVYQVFEAWCRNRFQEQICNCLLCSQFAQIPTTGHLFRVQRLDAFVLLICFCFFHL